MLIFSASRRIECRWSQPGWLSSGRSLRHALEAYYLSVLRLWPSSTMTTYVRRPVVLKYQLLSTYDHCGSSNSDYPHVRSDQSFQS